MQTLLLDGYDGGNSSCMINDYRANPFHDPHTSEALAEQPPVVGEAEVATGTPRGTSTAPNVRFCKVYDRGWPYLFIVSLRHLSAGEELLVDYGEDYWESRRHAALGPKQTVPLTTD